MGSIGVLRLLAALVAQDDTQEKVLHSYGWAAGPCDTQDDKIYGEQKSAQVSVQRKDANPFGGLRAGSGAQNVDCRRLKPTPARDRRLERRPKGRHYPFQPMRDGA